MDGTVTTALLTLWNQGLSDRHLAGSLCEDKGESPYDSPACNIVLRACKGSMAFLAKVQSLLQIRLLATIS